MTRDFLPSPLLSHAMPTSLADRITEMLDRRSMFEPGMSMNAVLIAVKRQVPATTLDEVDDAINSLIDGETFEASDANRERAVLSAVAKWNGL